MPPARTVANIESFPTNGINIGTNVNWTSDTDSGTQEIPPTTGHTIGVSVSMQHSSLKE